MDELMPLVPEIPTNQVRAWVWFAPLQHFTHDIAWLVRQIREDYASKKTEDKSTPDAIEREITNLRELQKTMKPFLEDTILTHSGLGGKILAAWQGEETVKSVASKLDEDENKIRVYFNRLAASRAILATDRRVGNYKIYLKI